MQPVIRTVVAAVVAVSLAGLAAAQGTDLALGGIRTDTGLPVEVTADSLTVNQSDGSATFTGNVLIGQGDMRLSAGTVRVEYEEGGNTRIKRLHATGGVTLASATEAAEAAEATYTIASGEIVMIGDVLLTQGANALSGQKLTVDIATGTGTIEGRVKTVLQTGGN